MTIYGITASEFELASAALEAFLGFFDQKFRDHDYDVGRTHARKVLTDSDLAKNGGIGPIAYQGSAIRPIDAALEWLKMSAAPAADLNGFKQGMEARVKQMVRALVGPVAAIPLDPLAELLTKEILNRVIAKS